MKSLRLDPALSPLLTDFYELTMMGGYFRAGRHLRPAAFEYFFRDLPREFGFVVFAGLEDLAERVQALRFGKEEIAYLRGLRLFPDDFLRALASFQFTGDIDAVPEGTIVFPHEPLVRVRAPLWEAQLLETLLLNCLNYPTLVAGKAARVCLTARPDPVIEFGLRRAQGPDGGVTASRAAYIGGCTGTSDVEAGRRFGIPVKGTHAHSWVMSFPDELTAFRAYLEAYPDSPILLVDTYHTIRSGVPNAIRAFRELREKGWSGRPAVRIDSGDLAADSIRAHALFGQAGLEDPLIVASNELDEHLIADLKRQGAMINAWGVGTHLVTCAGAGSLNGVYKLAAVWDEDGWVAKIKISGNPGKVTDPGIKRPVRFEEGNLFQGDLLLSEDETLPPEGAAAGVDRMLFYRKMSFSGKARRTELMAPLFRGGKRMEAPGNLEAIRARCLDQIERLPVPCLRLRNPEIYPVLLSEKLADLKARMLRNP